MIYGIGCDIVDIHRFEKYVDDKKRLKIAIYKITYLSRFRYFYSLSSKL